MNPNCGSIRDGQIHMKDGSQYQEYAKHHADVLVRPKGSISASVVHIQEHLRVTEELVGDIEKVFASVLRYDNPTPQHRQQDDEVIDECSSRHEADLNSLQFRIEGINNYIKSIINRSDI